MKHVYAILLILFLMGCGLMPKKVEYFQDKVEKMPAPTIKQVEVQKEAAEFVARKTDQTVKAAIHENSSTNVLVPAIDANKVATSLSGSLGKPEDPWYGAAEKLAVRLDQLDAKLDKKLEEFRKDNDRNSGKAIEGTGFVQMGYFTNLLMLAALGFMGWIAIKVAGIASGNPAVMVGTKIVEGAGKGMANLVSKGFSEVIEAGEHFKKKIDDRFEDPAVREEIKELFKQAHLEKQSRDVQEVIRKLTS